jgi:hypothetical protein
MTNDDKNSGLMDRAIGKLKSGTKRAGHAAWEGMKDAAEDLDEPEGRGREYRERRMERDVPGFGEDADDYDDYDEGVGMTGGLGVGMDDDGDPLSFGSDDAWSMEDEADDEYDDWLGGW